MKHLRSNEVHSWQPHKLCCRPRVLWSGSSGQGYLPFPVLWRKHEVLDLVGEWDRDGALLDGMLGSASQAGRADLAAKVEQARGNHLLRQGRNAEALEVLEQTRDYYQSQGDVPGLCRTLGDIGDVYGHQSDYPRALEHFEKMLELARPTGDRQLISQALNMMGNIHAETGKFEQACQHYSEWLELAQQDASQKDVGHATGSLGNVYYRQGKSAEALDCYQKALQIAQQVGDRYSIIAALGNCGVIHKHQQQFIEAMMCFQQVLAQSRSLGYKFSISLALGQLADLGFRTGRLKDAENYFVERLKLVEELGDRRGQCITCGNLGRLCLKMADLARAEEYLQRSIEVGRGIGIDYYLCEFLGFLADLRLDQGLADKSQLAAAEALEMATACNNQRVVWQARMALARVESKEKPAIAVAQMTALAEEAPDQIEKAEAYAELFRLTNDRTYRERALELFLELYEQTGLPGFRGKMEDLGA